MVKNVFGQTLKPCCFTPKTGFYRDGYCHTGPDDTGTHTVCAVMTKEFLEFSQSVGNDLITPRPEYDFPGLIPGDKWCLCLTRWIQAYHANVAPKVLLEATHEKTLDLIGLEELVKFAAK
ncbi:DUF2237 domain-containing protein [Cyclobacterium jeungdonense]|uniref:DUF2237 domain-containing protein n=1 Tax=Cyclobacterium jeungdonense TaxID=708087 RepID=A0ABT8C8F8_9BACT|nr:DUF2237 domain-containing protein [Cyclobacterium jeungdonense]MDN3688304.1 DUF2237 domain-containing protein [Cyclobacterium jeungdonense]